MRISKCSFIMKDECHLCKRVLPTYLLKRCQRCGRLFCRSCMTINLWSAQRDLICLNCARKLVSPPRISSKYSPLREFLCYKSRYSNLVTLTFSKIEGVIKSDLPFEALRKENWWKNSNSTSQGHAWISGGWQVQNVNIKERIVTFKKISEKLTIKPHKKPFNKQKKEGFTPIPVRTRKKRKPSKTRISKILARAKNVERRKTALNRKIKMKPKSVYEKRMYKPDEKPSHQD
jgi:hypothetical protein